MLSFNFFLKFETAGFLIILFTDCGRELEFGLRLQEKQVFKRKLPNFKQFYVVTIADPPQITWFQTGIRNILKQLLKVGDISILDYSFYVGSRHLVPIETLRLGLKRESHFSRKI